MSLTNPLLSSHVFLQLLEEDPSAKDVMLEGRRVLTVLCHQVEDNAGLDLDEFYELTQAAASDLNALPEQGVDIETDVCDLLEEEFSFIAHAYGFVSIDIEEALSTREW